MAEKKKSAAPANETKEQKLVRLANMRVPKAIKAISVIGNLKSYKPTAAQAKAIAQALADAVNHTHSLLTSAGTKTESSFTLPQ